MFVINQLTQTYNEVPACLSSVGVHHFTLSFIAGAISNPSTQNRTTIVNVELFHK